MAEVKEHSACHKNNLTNDKGTQEKLVSQIPV